MGIMRILFLTALCVMGSLADIDEEDGIMVITEDNFEEAIEDNPYIAIDFYAPWCGDCTTFAPKYVEVAKMLEKKNSKIKLGKVDVTVEEELARENDIRSYPTIGFFRNGVPINYPGELETDDLVDWLIKKAGPPAKELKSLDKAKAFLQAHDMVVLGFFKNLKSRGAKAFLEVASTDGEIEYAITSNEKIFKEFKAKDGTVILFKPFDEGRNVYEKKIYPDDLRDFIAEYSLPLIVDMDQKTSAKIFSSNVKNQLLAFLSEEAGHYDEYVEEFRKAAKKYRGQIRVVTVNMDDPQFASMVEFFGMKKDEIPAMRIIKMLDAGIHKYQPENPELRQENILKFVAAFLDGKLKRHLAAEELPEDWDAKPVKVLVGSNFNKVALDKSKNVLVEFYAPWCGHCKQLAPIYDELGEKYKNNKNVVIAKIDATANELESVDVKSYPTIILFKKKTNEAITFGGNRTLEDMSKFIDSDGVYGREEENDDKDEDNDRRKDEL
ncbi:protein disulfide-isomerase-like [Microplitis mediator]|uniref:protein disulfide-isomerase-like n=1 Tax=Microplitis mediator TaxID=375433 RepID=UPI002556414C|nr:protein disulfide-isomerase-like [Microplitis mediator]